jgi:hypothetical protein
MLTADRVPAIGQYDERRPEITSWRLEQMRRGGVEWCTYQHEWSPNLRQLLMNHCAENHPDDADIQFAFSWWDVLSSSSDGAAYYAEPKWTRDAVAESLRQYGAAVYPFTRTASYLRVGERPVLFRGAAQTLRFYERWGISPAEVMATIASAFPVRPYFVASGTDHEVYPLLRSWGFDAFTEYLLYGRDWLDVTRIYRDYWATSFVIAEESGLDFWVPALAGYDNRAFHAPIGDRVFMPTPAEFTAHLAEAHRFAREHYDVTRGRVISYAWNEYFEGGVLEPMQPDMLHSGDEMLRAHAEAARVAA